MMLWYSLVALRVVLDSQSGKINILTFSVVLSGYVRASGHRKSSTGRYCQATTVKTLSKFGTLSKGCHGRDRQMLYLVKDTKRLLSTTALLGRLCMKHRGLNV